MPTSAIASGLGPRSGTDRQGRTLRSDGLISDVYQRYAGVAPRIRTRLERHSGTGAASRSGRFSGQSGVDSLTAADEAPSHLKDVRLAGGQPRDVSLVLQEEPFRGHLERAQPHACCGFDGVEVEPGPNDHGPDGMLTADRNGGDKRLVDSGYGQQPFLDVARVDGRAADLEHVVAPRSEPQETVPVEHADVASGIVSVCVEHLVPFPPPDAAH